ncbi:hypothetical protein VF03_37990 [Nostoc linckia z2]|uniref:HEPN domain-containing protein n=1 Tax=Nostoc linckia TaxID=92942 RepID=UPI000BFFAB41|nr:hypothetical protein VF03_37990 [Nostoc linckia z2]
MPRSEVDEILSRIDTLVKEIEISVPKTNKNIEFRADLAGLLVVAISAAYEACVKETLVSHAANHHANFGAYAQNQFSKLNSRIALHDLYKYCKDFGTSINNDFSTRLKLRRERIMQRAGKDICASYTQILNWRHDFAHAGIKNTTIEEAIRTHIQAKRVIYCFNEAFC